MTETNETVQDRITREIFYPHPIDAVWAAISEGEAISEWFIKADFQPGQGYRYTFTHEDTVIKGEVLEVEAPRLLVYTWNIQGTGVDTVVRWRLSERQGGTELRLEHEGIEAYGESALNFFTSYSGGWDKTIAGLSDFLNGKTPDEN